VAVSLVIVNARVWTNDARRPWADAVAVEGDRIAAVGSSAEVMKRAGAARVIDAKGAMVIPGSEDPREAIVRAHSAETALVARGVLRAGTVADLTMFDRDLTQLAAASMGEAQVMLTVVRGVAVFAP
jgi:predicted amidohydrolase YtcJ